MLGNDSHLQSQEEADNQFLPNNSNSYESIIKEHQQRRSHILNDHLVFEAQEQSHNGRQSLAHESVKQEKTIEKKGLEQDSNPFPEDQQQNEQNQFLVNEKSLAASIKHALQSVNSKQNYSGSLHFQQNSINKEEEEEQIPHFGGLMGASILGKSNIEIDNEESQLLPSNEDRSKDKEYNWNMEIEEQSRHHHHGDNIQEESDPFRGVQEQAQANSNEQMQQKQKLEFNQIEGKVFLPNKSSNMNFEPSVQKQTSSKNISIQRDVSNQKSNLSGFDIDEQDHLKSRSQIEALQSILESNKSKIEVEVEGENKVSEPQQHLNESSNPFNESSKHSIKQNDQFQEENSLSRLVHQNLYQKQYQQAQKANSSQFVVVNRIVSSEVEVFQIPTINKMEQNSHLKSQIQQSNNIQFGEQSNFSKSSQKHSQKSLNNNSRIINESIKTQKQLQDSQLNIKQDEIYGKSIVDKYEFSSHNIMAESSNKSFKNHSQNEINRQIEDIENDDNQNHIEVQIKNPSERNDFSQKQNASIKSKTQNGSVVNEYNFNEQLNSAHIQQQKNQKEKQSLDSQNYSAQQFEDQQVGNVKIEDQNKRQNQKQASSFLQVNRSRSINQSQNNPTQKISVYKQKSYQLNPSKLSQSKKSVNQNIKLRNVQPSEAYSLKSSKKQAMEKESQLHLPYIENKRRQSQLLNGLKASSNFSKQSPSIKLEQGSKISSKSSKYSVQSKHHSSNIQKNQRDKIVSYSQGVSHQQETKLHLPQMQPSSTGIESKSTFTKKRQESNKEIFNTYPATFQVESIDQIGGAIQQGRKSTLKIEDLQQNGEKMKTVGSPSKQRESQVQRVRALKESHRKRLQRQLQKVKKQLQEINSWQKNMQKIYEQKQKLQNKEKQKALILKEKQTEAKRSKLSRQNQVILKIIKDHRKPKQQITSPIENSEDLNKNLAQLVNLRNQAQEKLKQQKRQQIAQRMKRNESRRLQEQKLIKVNNHYIKQFKSAEGAIVSPGKNIQPKVDKLNNYKGSKYQGNIRQKANPYEEKLD